MAAVGSATVVSAGLWFFLSQSESASEQGKTEPVQATAETSALAKTQPSLSRPDFPAALPQAPDTQAAAKSLVAAEPARAPDPAPAAPSRSASDSPRIGPERLVLRTIAGDMVLALYPDVAPETVAQVLRLARLGVYDTTHFGAMQPGFYLQLYNPDERLAPLSEEAEKSIKPIRIERSGLHHRRGTLSMPAASSSDPDTANSSFSIMLGDTPHVDGKQTVFGHVERGIEVLERIEQVPRWASTPRPELRLTILQAEVVPEPALPGLVLEGARPLADILHKEPLPALAVRANALLTERCLHCHGGDKPAGKLAMSSQPALDAGGQHGRAVYRGNALASPLFKRVMATDGIAMPREGARLSVAEAALLMAWIDDGANFPPGTGAAPVADTAEGGSVSAEDAAFWSFAPLRKVAPPVVKGDPSVRTPIDRFLLAQLKTKNLAFNSAADKRTLIRRLSFGLTGLPPTPAEVDAFVTDAAPDAYERLVDRLIASPAFGEHQARDWLDLVRYADSGGYENDDNRPFAYPYRDFVIRAFNDDLPYDTFLHWQIAGDEIAPDNPQALSATGFATAGPLQTFYPRQRDRYDELDDIVSTMGSAMLGLTVGCARCHDHKYDPIPQHDYYRLQAIFSGTRREERFLTPGDATELQRQIDYFRVEAERLERSQRAAALTRKISALSIPEADKALLRQPKDANNSRQTELFEKLAGMLEITDVDMFPDNDDRVALSRLTAQLDELKERKQPKCLTLAGSGYGRAFYLDRGDPDREREAVPPGFVTVLTAGRPAWTKHTWEAWSQQSPGHPLPQPRRALANWLTDVDRGAGRLVARVVVNRLWQHHFGEGLVRTPNDFGAQGDRPAHPELLDWLAGELIANGWHLKPIHRLIVTSTAYRQAIASDGDKAKIDPDNRLVGRRRLQRLSAEMLRDALLAVGGNLNRAMYGPGVKPPMPTEAIFPTAPKHGEVWPADAVDGPPTWRRSIYVVTKRSNPVPFLQTFDCPDAAASCGHRLTTTVPTQALILLNDPFVVSQSRRFAERVRAASGDAVAEQVRQAFRAAYGRSPDAAEAERSEAFLKGHSLPEFCQVLVQSNEFAYVD
jgi:cyclophilin family peptidyl-prolyl cis-trans isomerase